MPAIFSKRGCALGCGSVVFLIILLGTGVFISVDRHFDKAADLRVAVEEKYGRRSEWNPGPSPSLTRDRLERFLSVRRGLQGVCASMTSNNNGMNNLDQVDDQKNVPDGTVVKAGWQSARSMFGIVTNLGDFAIARNNGLLAAEMGMGEYTWIYTLVYYGVLEEKPRLGMGEDVPGNMPSSARKDLARMMSDHATALSEAGPEFVAEAKTWQQESVLLKSELKRMPFAGNAPDQLVAVIAPYFAELSTLFCPSTDALELMRIKRNGIGYGDND